MCQEAYTKEKLKGRGKGCKKGGGTGTGKTDTTGQKTHTRKAWKTQWNNGTNWNGEHGGGGKDCKKEKTQEQRAHTGKARKMHKKPHMKTPHIY